MRGSVFSSLKCNLIGVSMVTGAHKVKQSTGEESR